MATLTFEQEKLILRAAMDKQGITDPELRAGIAAIAMGESAFQMRPEIGYSHTSNDRIREIFVTKCGDMSDDELDTLKANDETFFNYVYANIIGNGDEASGDGFKFRGRGFIQLTGRFNYNRYGNAAGVDLVSDPERANTPENAAAIAVAYMRLNYRGGGWEAMKRAVGRNVVSVGVVKDRYFAQFLATGEFGPLQPGEVPPATPTPLPGPPKPTPAVTTAADRIRAFQQALRGAGLYRGEINGKFDADCYTALAQLRLQALQEIVKGA